MAAEVMEHITRCVNAHPSTHTATKREVIENALVAGLSAVICSKKTGMITKILYRVHELDGPIKGAKAGDMLIMKIKCKGNIKVKTPKKK